MRLAQDKKKHIIAGWYIMTLLGIWSIYIGVIACIAAILGKEFYDYNHPDTHFADIEDVYAGFIGLLAGSATIGILYLLNPFELWLEMQSYVTAFLLFAGFCVYWTYCRVGGKKLF